MKILSFSDPALPEPLSAQIADPKRFSAYLKDLVDTLKRNLIRTAVVVNANRADSGVTADRPTTDPNLITGQAYFDTTIGKPVWWNGATWVNSAGVPS